MCYYLGMGGLGCLWWAICVSEIDGKCLLNCIHWRGCCWLRLIKDMLGFGMYFY